MAEIVLSVLLPVVFEKLASVALNKFGAPSKENHSDLKKLESSLSQIQALLNDASDKEIKETRVKVWLNRLQHLAYDMDDVLDALATDAMHRELTEKEPTRDITSKVKKLIIPTCCTTTFSSSSSLSSSTAKVQYRKLNEITTKLQQLYDEKNNLGLTVKDKRSSQDINRGYQTSLLTPGIVGRDAEKEILLQKMLGDEPNVNQNNFSIMPIVGMGGIGKTTLARLLYNEPKVNQHFDLKAWVCVSDEFDSFKINELILESVGGQGKKYENLNLLQEALKNQLFGKRFLLVLDDVWTEKIQDWETLVPPFHAAAPGSKIILTTRKEQLLQQLGYGNPYHLNKLSHDDALSLFAQHALGANNFDSNPTLRPYGEGIVKKCDGLPLALKALGSSLRTKTNDEKWKELLDNEIWSLQDRGGILPALRLSYLDLSACLKQLFAYSCLFPKDYVFDKEDLILLWMAEGFLLESSTSKSMECLGEEYFDELLSRSIFQHAPNDESLFMMHDLMNDLATSVAGEFFIRLDIDMGKNIREHTLEKYRHMSFVREKYLTLKKFKAFERATNLRTFVAVPVVMKHDWWVLFYLSNKILDDLLPRLPLLRALSLSDMEIEEVPESVGNLKHLRYLNLSRTRITHLPENVCNLYNLQTLIVVGCGSLRKLPDNFLKLKNLRHFDISDTRLLKNMPLGIGEIKSLQTLSKIVIGGENEFPISGLKNLKNLRRSVCIHGLEKLQNNDQAREANLSQMKLNELVLEWSYVFDGSRKQRIETDVLDMLKPHSDNLKKLEVVSYGGTEFPKWVTDPLFVRLTDVSIKNCRNCKVLPPLGQLQSLKKLCVESMGDVKEVGSEFAGNGPAAFPSLEVLIFEDMPRWEVWSVNVVGGVAVFPCLKELYIRDCLNMARCEVRSPDANVMVFPCLEKLWISKCPSLVSISLEALPSLRFLRIWDCGDRVFESLVGVASSVTELDVGNISGGVSGEFTCKVSLPLLKVLSIDNCGEGVLKSVVSAASSSVTRLRISGISGLSDEVWGGVVHSLPALEQLRISKCNEISYLWESESEASKVLVNLNKLEISHCDHLVRIGRDGSNLLHLTSLRLWNCENLEHLSCSTNSIQDLNIKGCSSITSVCFPTKGGIRGWQELKKVRIEGCNSVLQKELEKQVLITTNNTTNIMPILEVLCIDNWIDLKSIKKFTSSFIQLTRFEVMSCPMIIESFPDLQNLTSLKHLVIRDCPSMDGPPPPLPLTRRSVGVWPPKLESLFIGKLKTPISEWGPLPTSSLFHLTLVGGFGSSSTEEDDVKSFPISSFLIPSSSLKRLVLYDFKKMERISSEGLQHLTSLQHLEISSCPKLKDLPHTLLPSLLTLKIFRCEELKERMSRGGSYWPLLSHIPHFYISP